MTRSFHILAGMFAGILLATATVRAQTPSSAVEAAAVDAAKLPPERLPYIRWLSMYHLDTVKDKDLLEKYDKALRLGCNMLSRESKIKPPTRVLANLWRVDFFDYRWSIQVWERLAEAPDPFFHVQLVDLVEKKGKTRTIIIEHKGGDLIDPRDGYVHKNLPAKSYSYEITESGSSSGKTKAAIAPWINTKVGLALSEATQSIIPVVRLDWWIFQTFQARDRKAGYYDWLALGKKEADFFALGKANFKDSEEIRMLRRANVRKSDVVHFARGIEGAGALTDGVAFLTRDYASTIENKNALRLLERDAPPDGGEGYITLPNGLFAFWIQDAKGNRVDFVPATIASNRNDTKISGTRAEVEVAFGCISCHVEGLRPIDSWVKQTYVAPFRLEGYLEEDTLRLQAAYDGNLLKLLKRGNDTYAEALKECNGLSPSENAKLIAEIWNRYSGADRTPAEFAAEVGIDEKTLIECLSAEAKYLEPKKGKLDPILISVKRGQKINVEHLEEIFALTHEIVARHRGKE